MRSEKVEIRKGRSVKQMEELVDVLNWIHRDLLVVATILICFVLFKDCHGDSHSGIVDELRDIKSAIQHKKWEGR